MQLECKVDRSYDDSTCLVSPGCGKTGLAIPYVAVNVREGKVITQVVNVSNHFVTLKEGYSIESIEEIDEVLDTDTAEDTLPKVRTCSRQAGEPQWDDVDSSLDSGTTPKTGVDDDPILKSIFKKLPYQTLEEVDAHMPEYTRAMFESSCENLMEEQAIIFGNLLIDFQNIFAKDDTDLGCSVGVEHQIDTGDAKPIKQPMRRVPLAFTGEEEKHLKKMLDCHVIQPSTS